MKVNGLATKGKVMDNPFGGKAVTAYCAGLAVCLFHKVTLIQPEVYLGNALLDIYHIKIICEYLWKDTTQQLLGLHDAKITNTYEIMCLRGRGCNWVLRLTRSYYIVIDNLQPGEYGINLGDPDKLNEKNNMKVTTFNVK